MKEITMIASCEITSVAVISDEDAEAVLMDKDGFTSAVRNIILEDTKADDVNILKNQIFIRDLPDQ